MKFHAKFPVKRRLLKVCLIAITFMIPLIGSTSRASAADGDLEHDGRVEGYGKVVYLDVGTAPDFLLLGGLTLLAVSVLFKDAKRTHKKS